MVWRKIPRKTHPDKSREWKRRPICRFRLRRVKGYPHRYALGFSAKIGIRWRRGSPFFELRTNQRFALKTSPLTRTHLDSFVSSYRADDQTQREEIERFRRFTHEELTQRDTANLDIFWLRDESLEVSQNLPPPDHIAEEIMEDLRTGLEQFEEIAADWRAEKAMRGNIANRPIT